MYLVKKIRDIYGLDDRAILLFKFFLGLVILSDIALRAMMVDTIFTDEGILPRWVQVKSFTEAWRFDLFLATGNRYIVLFLLVINSYLVWLFMTAKKNVRLITFGVWIFLISAQSRNFLILQSGDSILRLVLFWFLFFPETSQGLHSRFSISSNNKKINLGVMAYYLQIALIYFFAGYAKSYESYFSKGDAVFLAMELERYSTPFGQWLMKFPVLLKTLTRLSYLFELSCPFLILVPIKNWIFRTIAIFSAFSFHIGTILMMEVGHFPHAAMVMWLPLIPSQVLDFFFRSDKKTVEFVVEYEKKGVLEWMLSQVFFLKSAELKWQKKLKLQSEKRVYRVDGEETSCDNFHRILFSHSFFHLFLDNKLFRGFFLLLVNFENIMTELVSINKAKLIFFGKVVVNSLLIFLIYFTFVFNLSQLNTNSFRWKKIINKTTENNFLRYGVYLDQAWGMFSPIPTLQDGWHLVYGERINGNKVDLWGTDFTKPFEKPRDVAGTYKNFRWRKYLGALMGDGYKGYKQYFWRNICSEVNSKIVDPMRKIKKVHHYFILEQTNLDGTVSPLEKKKYGEYKCNL